MSGYAFADPGAAASDFLRTSLQFGAAFCLRKPFRPEALLAVVNQCFSKPSMSGY
jgi:hypothetical protein